MNSVWAQALALISKLDVEEPCTVPSPPLLTQINHNPLPVWASYRSLLEGTSSFYQSSLQP